MSHSAIQARLQILGAALLFSTGAAAVKASSISVWQLAGLRAGAAAVFLLLVLPAARRLWDVRVLAVGALYAVATVTYVAANRLTTAGNVMFVAAVTPVAVLLLGAWWLGEKATRRDLLFLVPMIVGLVLCLAPAQPALETAPNPRLGNLFAVGFLAVWATLLVAMRALARGKEVADDLGPAAIAAGNLMAAAVCLPMAGSLSGISELDWAIVLYLGLVQIGLAYVWLTAGIRRVPVFESSLLLLAEPVFNPLWAWAAHGELPTRWAGLGGAIILISLATKLWLVDRRAELGPRETILSEERREN
jgi:drug/metabolite transporter (DMT)-like permease